MKKRISQKYQLFDITRLAALLFLFAGLLFNALLLNLEPVESEWMSLSFLLISGIFPLVAGFCLLVMIFCPESWSKYLSTRALFLATLGCGFIFLYAIISFTERFFLSPALMSGFVGEAAKLLGVLFLAGSFVQWVLEQRIKEEKLQISRNRYLALVESQQDMIVTIDPDNRLTFVNNACCKAFGQSKEEMVGACFAAGVQGDDMEDVLETLERLRNPPYQVSFEQRVKTKKGWRWIWWRHGVISDESGRITEIQGIGRDITEQKLDQQELQKVKERFQAVISNSPLLISEIDLDGRIQFANPAATDSFQLPPDGMNDKLLGDIFPPAVAEAFRARIDRVKTTQVPVEVEDSIPVGASERLYRTVFFPLFDASGRVSSIGAIGTDITEYRKLSTNLRISEKLAALGELVAGVAHEIKNPLHAMMGFAKLLLVKEDGITDEVREDIRKIYEASQRINTITDGLLNFSRKGSAEKAPVDINAILTDALKLKENHLKSGNIEVETNFDPALPVVHASKEQLNQVVLNLVNNAEYVMREKEKGGTLTVSTSREKGRVRIDIADTGPGIPEEIMDNLFSPFFTTKPEGQGTGLGLSVSHGIIEEHKGHIQAENAKSGGAVLTVILPETSQTEEED